MDQAPSSNVKCTQEPGNEECVVCDQYSLPLLVLCCRWWWLWESEGKEGREERRDLGRVEGQEGDEVFSGTCTYTYIPKNVFTLPDRISVFPQSGVVAASLFVSQDLSVLISEVAPMESSYNSKI